MVSAVGSRTGASSLVSGGGAADPGLAAREAIVAVATGAGGPRTPLGVTHLVSGGSIADPGSSGAEELASWHFVSQQELGSPVGLFFALYNKVGAEGIASFGVPFVTHTPPPSRMDCVRVGLSALYQSTTRRRPPKLSALTLKELSRMQSSIDDSNFVDLGKIWNRGCCCIVTAGRVRKWLSLYPDEIRDRFKDADFRTRVLSSCSLLPLPFYQILDIEQQQSLMRQAFLLPSINPYFLLQLCLLFPKRLQPEDAVTCFERLCSNPIADRRWQTLYGKALIDNHESALSEAQWSRVGTAAISCTVRRPYRSDAAYIYITRISYRVYREEVLALHPVWFPLIPFLKASENHYRSCLKELIATAIDSIRERVKSLTVLREVFEWLTTNLDLIPETSLSALLKRLVRIARYVPKPLLSLLSVEAKMPVVSLESALEDLDTHAPTSVLEAFTRLERVSSRSFAKFIFRVETLDPRLETIDPAANFERTFSIMGSRVDLDFLEELRAAHRAEAAARQEAERRQLEAANAEREREKYDEAMKSYWY